MLATLVMKSTTNSTSQTLIWHLFSLTGSSDEGNGVFYRGDSPGSGPIDVRPLV